MPLWLSSYHQNLEKKKLGGGEVNLNGGANLIVCFTVRLLIKTSYRLVVSGVIFQIFFYLRFPSGLEKKK